jgi:hypothetical protein
MAYSGLACVKCPAFIERMTGDRELQERAAA